MAWVAQQISAQDWIKSLEYLMRERKDYIMILYQIDIDLHFFQRLTRLYEGGKLSSRSIIYSFPGVGKEFVDFRSKWRA